MSNGVTNLKIVEGGVSQAKRKLLADAQVMHEHRQLDQWTLGDDAFNVVLEEAPEACSGRARNKGTTPVYGPILSALADDVRKVAPTIATPTLFKCFDTARAWPKTDRLPDKASFSAHAAFNAEKWDRRRAKVLRELAQRSSTGYVTRDLARLRASDDTERPEPRTPLERMPEVMASAMRRLWNPVDRVSLDDRKAANKILRQLGASFEIGDFR